MLEQENKQKTVLLTGTCLSSKQSSDSWFSVSEDWKLFGSCQNGFATHLVNAPDTNIEQAYI